MLSFPTERFCSRDCSDELFCSGEPDGEAFSAGFGGGGCELDWSVAAPFSEPWLPMVEKFHLPVGVRSSETCGRVRVISRISSVFERISGSIFTPTFNASALTNGVWLKAGSSAISILSAAKLPDQSDKFKLPTVTFRPR